MPDKVVGLATGASHSLVASKMGKYTGGEGIDYMYNWETEPLKTEIDRA